MEDSLMISIWVELLQRSLTEQCTERRQILMKVLQKDHQMKIQPVLLRHSILMKITPSKAIHPHLMAWWTSMELALRLQNFKSILRRQAQKKQAEVKVNKEKQLFQMTFSFTLSIATVEGKWCRNFLKFERIETESCCGFWNRDKTFYKRKGETEQTANTAIKATGNFSGSSFFSPS